jgi:hypothetical protein
MYTGIASVVVRSTYPLTPEQQSTIEQRIRDLSASIRDVTFEVSEFWSAGTHTAVSADVSVWVSLDELAGPVAGRVGFLEARQLIAPIVRDVLGITESPPPYGVVERVNKMQMRTTLFENLREAREYRRTATAAYEASREGVFEFHGYNKREYPTLFDIATSEPMR